MAFRIRRYLHEPALWSSMSILLTIASCGLYSSGLNYWWWIICLLAAIWCSERVIRETYRLRRSVNYLISAAMNEDFSYKFPVNNVAENERNINRMLNLLVEHLEHLSERARQQEEFLSMVINLVDIGIVVANEKGHVIHCNNAARQLLSLPVLKDICQIPTGNQGLEIKKRKAQLQGESIDIYTISDISHTIQTAEVESLSKLIRVLTHEIMNSLTPVNSISTTLSRQLAEGTKITDNADLRQQIDAIRSSSSALMDFVKNFRKFTILPEPKPQLLYVKPFLERQLSLAKPYAEGKDVEMRLLVFPPDTMIYTDGNLLGQVIMNILKNAIEASPHLIETDVSVRDDESVEINISNDGELIPEDIYAQIFTPFFTTKNEGSGIGLSLSRRIVAQLGGTLTLSIRPDTKFTIILP